MKPNGKGARPTISSPATATIRADRKMIHDMYLAAGEKPGEAKGEWDLYNVLQTLPGEKTVNRPLFGESMSAPRRSKPARIQNTLTTKTGDH